MIPVIAIDGPSASGKGTVAQRVAQRLGFHYLDSGALYRLTALAVARQGLEEAGEEILGHLAARLPVEFVGNDIRLAGEVVTEAIRTEDCGHLASRLSTFPAVRSALLERQRNFLRAPGLVADGRDMGSVVFPQALLKVFLTATPEVRAERRFNQLISKGVNVIMADVVRDLRDRDERDRTRAVAPLDPTGALILDTSALSIDQAMAQILAWYSMNARHEG
ncbi:(d)CMP kinase [Ferrovum sp.]|uniref:(d)CMP kinase n=1 Tax=Ferrovum sp. TaxID=2609467 RepID=UPI002639621B|nr:(d)CMP kinase [Ferrovum sp.]